jgi:two-component system CheB/CheR fusion protein
MNFGTAPKRYFGLGLMTAAAYIASAKLGLTLAFVAQQVTVVWPPTGIALAAVLLLGYRIWPFIAFGAFIANITTHTPVITSLGIATGNTLEALAGAILLRRIIGIDPSLHRFRDIFGIVVFGGIVSTNISATIGTFTLCATGIQAWENFTQLWSVWFLGDAMGNVVFAPLVLTLFSQEARKPVRRRPAEFLGLILVLAAISLLVFGGSGLVTSGYAAPDYAVLPILMWAALRFGMLGTSFSIFIISTVAVLGTVKGFGPFAGGSTNENLISLQLFMFVAALTCFVIAIAKSGRDRAEELMHRSEERYRSLVLASSQVVWSTNAAGEVVEDLPTWTAFTGQSGAKALGRGWTRMVHPDDLDETLRVWENSLTTGTGHENEFRVMSADGVYKYVHAHAMPVLDGTGRVREWIGTLTDVTARREAAQQLQIENRRKDEFLAMLAHELRNPLAPIASALEVIRSTQGDKAHLDDMCHIMSRQVHHMSRLLDDLLDVSRITRGVVELNKQIVNLSALAERSLHSSRLSIEKKSIVLTTRFADAPLPVLADATRMEQVISNLINNAVKFTPAGGGIFVSTALHGNSALFVIRDTGRGIAEGFLPHVFDLFAQADRSLARSEGGLGLGLTLVRTLVLMHGGQVEARSAGVGHGSEFTVRLPLSHVVHDALSAESNADSSRKQTILVIEDNADSAEALSRMLRLMGHEAEVAYDGVQGLEKFAELQPTVVLLDIGLPKINGYEVAKRLRSENPLLKLIALTGYGGRAERDRTFEAGFDDHLVKPVDFAVLEKLLG